MYDNSMMVVTSILSGEFTTTTTPSPKGQKGFYSKKNKQHQRRFRARTEERSETASSSFHEEEEDRGLDDDDSGSITTVKGNGGHDTNVDVFSSAGSTCLGDSFVLAIDWETTTANVGPSYYHDTANRGTVANHGLNESLEDPFLQPVESIRRRLLRSQDKSREACSIPKKLISATLSLAENAAVRSVCRIIGGSATKKKRSLRLFSSKELQPKLLDTSTTSAMSLGSFDMPAAAARKQIPDRSFGSIKSLGSFEFPAVSEDEGFDTGAEEEANFDANRPSAEVTVPFRALFEPPSFTILDDVDDDDEEEENNNDESYAIPTNPVLTKPATPSRKRRHAALQRAKELKADLERLRKQAATGSSPKQLQTAKLYLQLGLTEQEAHQYPAAINSFFQAAAIFRHISRPVALATALDHAAVAYCKAHQESMTTLIHRQHKVSRFYRCLYEALQLRKHELGPWHVDTVDTLQHLAQLCLSTGQAATAAGHYLEVVHLRKAIFGPNHPGTAVTAHCLGNAYLQAHDTVAAELWYDHALAVYNSMQLPNGNPAVAKLLRDRKRLERVNRWIEENPAEDENLLFEL